MFLTSSLFALSPFRSHPPLSPAEVISTIFSHPADRVSASSFSYQYLIREGAWAKRRKSAVFWEGRNARFVALCAIWVWPLPLSIECPGWSRTLQKSVSLQLKPTSLHLWGLSQGLQDKYQSGIIWQRQPDTEILKDKLPGFRRKPTFEGGYRRCCTCNPDCPGAIAGTGTLSGSPEVGNKGFMGPAASRALPWYPKWLCRHKITLVRLFLLCSSVPAWSYSHPMSQPWPGTVCSCVPGPWGIPAFWEVGEKTWRHFCSHELWSWQLRAHRTQWGPSPSVPTKYIRFLWLGLL